MPCGLIDLLVEADVTYPAQATKTVLLRLLTLHREDPYLQFSQAIEKAGARYARWNRWAVSSWAHRVARSWNGSPLESDSDPGVFGGVLVVEVAGGDGGDGDQLVDRGEAAADGGIGGATVLEGAQVGGDDFRCLPLGAGVAGLVLLKEPGRGHPSNHGG